ncbi:hypothetical protein PTTW11_11410 [Pyrenophora teres f. teres]|uniref:Uncharacterized protein n=1 Tax=Pyrenophora teres f. teres TaxID=97479 RepID=A0A6S6WHE5_9PLEO|nr:hypothetical protein PTNB29_10501 [Pyrenophora teres f. teres]CAE7221357.1 hypothetical protein PTTW11_11410 [Pyrenophora teres f. teres]
MADRGMWADGHINALAFCTNGDIDDTIEQATIHIFEIAHQLLTRTTPGAVQPVAPTIPGQINIASYRVWYIFDVRVAEEFRRVFATAAPDLRRVFDRFCRPRGQSPYDATFGAGPRDFSPVVARTTLHARQILSGRPSYLKAFLVHSRGGLNARFCTNCAPVLEGAKEFTAFAGCVSVPGEWGGVPVRTAFGRTMARAVRPKEGFLPLLVRPPSAAPVAVVAALRRIVRS